MMHRQASQSRVTSRNGNQFLFLVTIVVAAMVEPKLATQVRLPLPGCAPARSLARRDGR